MVTDYYKSGAKTLIDTLPITAVAIGMGEQCVYTAYKDGIAFINMHFECKNGKGNINGTMFIRDTRGKETVIFESGNYSENPVREVVYFLSPGDKVFCNVTHCRADFDTYYCYGTVRQAYK